MRHAPGAQGVNSDAERTPATASALATAARSVGRGALRRAGASSIKKDRIAGLLFERLGGLSMAARLRQIFALLLSILQVTFPLLSSAQQQPTAPAPLQLTLKQTVQLALKQNPQRVIALLLVSESDRNSQIARSALLPHAGIAASGSLNQYNVQSIERAAKPAHLGPFQIIEAGPNFSQSILNFQEIRGYQIGREGTHQARAD